MPWKRFLICKANTAKTAAIMLAIKTDRRAMGFTSVPGKKANWVISSETVKPTPASKPIAKMSPQNNELFNSALETFVASQAKPSTPIGLPTTNPRTIPSETGEDIVSPSEIPVIEIPAAKNANTGTHKPADHGWN